LQQGGTSANTADVFIYQFSDTYIGTVRTALETDLKAKSITATFYDGGGVSGTQVQQIENAICQADRSFSFRTSSSRPRPVIRSLPRRKPLSIPAIFFNREVPDTAVTADHLSGSTASLALIRIRLATCRATSSLLA
jgi:methyl-galactoside transport system substrate-binding protein